MPTTLLRSGYTRVVSGCAIFRIILEIDGAVVAVIVFAFADEDFLSGEIIILLLFVQLYLAPVVQRRLIEPSALCHGP